MAGSRLAEPSSAIVPDLQEKAGIGGIMGIGVGVGRATVAVVAGVLVAFGVPVPFCFGEVVVPFTPAVELAVGIFLSVGELEGCGEKRKEESNAPNRPNKSKITTMTGNSLFKRELSLL